jgi:hypothetical protein
LLRDSAGDPLDLSLTTDGDGFKCGNAPNIGLCWTSTISGARGNAEIADKLTERLQGVRAITIELVVRLENADSAGSRLIHIGEVGDQAGLGVLSFGAGNLAFSFNDTKVVVAEPVPSTSLVLHVIYDTAAGEIAQRIRAFISGVEVVVTNPGADCPPGISCGFPGQNTALNIAPAARLVLGNDHDGGRAIVGAIHYAAIYDTALAQEDVSARAALLADDDDS